ncbi:uncharacterized protein [Amphiura filiformis]|uniref:uncharacterized protein n=1 Tax=Amphiura filiformis TaxID=82378 RepID=UPI003B226A3D
MSKAIKFLIAALTAIICACGHGGAKDCFIGQQSDPDHIKLGLRWVLSYTNKDVLCTCTKILFGGMNPTPLPGLENFFYSDDLLLLNNNDNVTELREKLGCRPTDSKATVSRTSRATTIPGNTPSIGNQLSTKAAIASSTSQTIIKSESSTQGQLTTEGETLRYVCEDDILHLGCEEGRFINVTSAIYGRQDGIDCPGPVQTTNCVAGNSLQVVQNLCNGNHMCDVQASNGVFGDPCGGTAKYLEISFGCIEDISCPMCR